MPNDTALHKSCHNGELDAVQRLIEGGEFDVNEGAWVGKRDEKDEAETGGSRKVS